MTDGVACSLPSAGATSTGQVPPSPPHKRHTAPQTMGADDNTSVHRAEPAGGDPSGDPPPPLAPTT